MPTIINTDTVWHSGEIIRLNDDYQVAAGVTLTIEAGAIVQGGSIAAFGNISAQGTDEAPILFQDTNITAGRYDQPLGVITLDHVQIDGGILLPPLPNGGYVQIQLTNSLISNNINSASGYSYIWYPAAGSQISNNIFIDMSGLSVGTDEDLDISDNIFVRSSGTYSQSSLEVWANYGDHLTIQGNSYLDVPKYASASNYGANFSETGSYYGVSDPAQIAALVFDVSDDLSRGNVSIVAPQTAPLEGTRTEIVSFTDIRLPSAVITDVRLIGGLDADVIGSDLANVLIGNEGNNEITGLAGSDAISGLGGDDTLSGSAGNDSLTGGLGDDSIYGGDGDDTLIGVAVPEQQIGFPSAPYGSDGNDLLDGGNGNDTIIAGSGDTVLGGEGTDYIFVTGSLLPTLIDGGSNTADGGGPFFGPGDSLFVAATGATEIVFAGGSVTNIESVMVSGGGHL